LLADRLRSLDPGVWQEDTYVWAGCEQAAARSIRSYLKSERRIPRKQYLVAAYWRRGQAGEVED
ncbi:SIP domain-containing protein, partial [Rhizobiaceae sp. 2RAB30]